MEHLNKIELIGTVGKHDVKEFSSGINLHEFTLGVSNIYSGAGGSVSQVSWFHCSYWGDTDKIVKGQDLHISGRMVGNTYASSDGGTRTYYEVKVQQIW